MIINRIYENQNLLSLLLFSFLVGLKTYQHPCTPDKAELLAQHFEWIRHLNSDRGMAHRARIVHSTVGRFFVRPQPHFHETNLTSPAELRRLIESLKTKSAPGKVCILALMLHHLSRKGIFSLVLF